MNRLRTFLALFVMAFALLFIEPVALAEPTPEPQTVEELVAAVESTYGDVQGMRADFVQVTRSATGDTKIRGKVSMQRPSQMRWDSTKDPGGSLFVSDGKKIWLYTPDAKQVMVFPDLSSGLGQMDLLSSLESLDEQYDVELKARDGGKDKRSFVVVLRPKVEAGQYTEMRLVMSRNHYKLQQVTMVDAFGGETEITFTGLKLNPNIPAEEFSFQAPEGVEIIEADKL